MSAGGTTADADLSDDADCLHTATRLHQAQECSQVIGGVCLGLGVVRALAAAQDEEAEQPHRVVDNEGLAGGGVGCGPRLAVGAELSQWLGLRSGAVHLHALRREGGAGGAGGGDHSE